MNTISMTVKMAKATLTPRLQLGAVKEFLASQTHPVSHRARPVLVGHPLRVPMAKGVAETAWGPRLSGRFTMKLLCGLLALSAIAWIACGFLSMLEHVQNWPAINAWVGRILGA
jgi:hypothetical protein